MSNKIIYFCFIFSFFIYVFGWSAWLQQTRILCIIKWFCWVMVWKLVECMKFLQLPNLSTMIVSLYYCTWGCVSWGLRDESSNQWIWILHHGCYKALSLICRYAHLEYDFLWFKLSAAFIHAVLTTFHTYFVQPRLQINYGVGCKTKKCSLQLLSTYHSTEVDIWNYETTPCYKCMQKVQNLTENWSP